MVPAVLAIHGRSDLNVEQTGQMGGDGAAEGVDTELADYRLSGDLLGVRVVGQLGWFGSGQH
ncbi:hypothetical protein GCM10009827_058720 [Dactylosporangium maewongense]|uniref:Uncharacterized protein n=1 Tax=Dactylosporangium maewongense TaxID=634393 RepID=A0ABP4LX63_9ACTN